MSPTTTRGQVRSKNARAGASARTTKDEAPEPQAAPRTGAKKTVMYYMKQLPAYLRLLGGLLTDRRVSGMDKMMVAGAIAYIVMPLDVIPDFIPFLGEVDDVFILVLALQRLIANAGRKVLIAHWKGSLADLDDLNLREVLAAAAFFMPRTVRKRLRVLKW